MKRKLYKISFLIISTLIVMISVLLHPIDKRIDILSDYKQLLSDQETVKRLESIPPIKKWKHIPGKNLISIGYAYFSFPFGEIFEISEAYRRVIIDSDNAKVNISFILLDDIEVDLEHPEKYLPALTFKGDGLKIRETKYKENDITLWKLEAETPFHEFKRKVFEIKPKPIAFLLFMNLNDLYIYEKLLEVKNSELSTGETYLFETEKLRGIVQKQGWIEEKHNYASCYMVFIWDLENKIYQLVQITSYVDEITEDEINQFVSSLLYDMDVIDSNSDDLRAVILKTLRENEYYSPELQEANELPLTAE